MSWERSSGRQTVNGSDSGVILANGHTVEEIQSMMHLNPGPAPNMYVFDPKLIGPDGRANPEYLTVPTTPGEFGQFVYLRGPNLWQIDGSLNKSVPIVGRTQLMVHLTIQNLLNHPVWGTGLGFLTDMNITSTTFAQATGPQTGGGMNLSARSMYLRVGVTF